MAERARTSDTKDLDDLRADLEHLKEDMAGLLKGLGREARSKARAAQDEIEHGATKLSERLRERLEDLEQNKVVSSIGRQVSEHPALTMLAVFGLGWLAGRFNRR